MIVKGFLPVPDSNFLVHWVLVACSGCSTTTSDVLGSRSSAVVVVVVVVIVVVEVVL